jgi:hypothetical protein
VAIRQLSAVAISRSDAGATIELDDAQLVTRVFMRAIKKTIALRIVSSGGGLAASLG